MTNQPAPVILSDEALAEIEARANAATEGPWEIRPSTLPPYSVGVICQYESHDCLFVPDSAGAMIDSVEMTANLEFASHARTDIPALCQTVRVLRAENERLNRLIAEATVTAPWRAGYTDYVPTAGDPVRSVKDLIAHIQKRGATVSELESSVTFWKAEALLNHFCSEHASNKRQLGHYCTVCAKPFVMTVPQGERPPKYKDLITENTALREQLAENARRHFDDARSLERQRDELLSRLAQVEKERDSFPSRAAALCREKAVVHDMRCGTQFPNPLECDCAAKQFIILADELEQLQP